MDSLISLIHSHPLIDNHAHNILSAPAATNYADHPFEQIISEAQGPALENALSSLPLHRAAAQLATLYQMPSTSSWEELKAARDDWVSRDYAGLVRACLTGTHSLLLDDLLTDRDVEPYHWHDSFTPGRTKRIVRIETLAAQTAASATDFAQFRQGFHARLAAAIADPVVVGFKSVICYRTGLNIVAHEPADACVVEDAFLRLATTGAGSGYRVEDKPLNDWLVRYTLGQLRDAKAAGGANKPLQLHTGLGDNDIDLVLSNPAYLQPVIAAFPEVDFVLLHSAYPYTRQAGYLACVFNNVYLDLGEVFPMVSRDAQESILREALEIVPTARLIWSTDGHFFPETFYLANVQFRQALERVFVEYVHRGDWTVAIARAAVADILFHNSNRLYCLEETLVGVESDGQRIVSSAAVSPSASSTDLLARFLRANPSVQYIWMQFLDYTNTTRVRMFPIREFAKLAAQTRRIGICSCLQQMIQDDHIHPDASTTGQFYMTPDLGSLTLNLGVSSSSSNLSATSASVATFWRTEDNSPLPGCPRTLLQKITSQIESSYHTTVTTGFEIEVIFVKPSTDPNPNPNIQSPYTYTPSTTNHSWSQMTTQTLSFLPLLEEIASTLSAQGIPIEQFHAESAPGQFEFILPPSPPLRGVDTLLTARQTIVQIADRHGLRATLHPRPIARAAGSAAHAHVSLSPADRQTEEAFLAGLLRHYPAVVGFALAQEASYDRVRSGLWAGSEWVAWGTQNRETPVRKIGAAHWEMKSLDGLANMYLAVAAVLAAGWLGLREGLELGVGDCKYDAATLSPEQRAELGITTPMPKSLEQSLAALEADTALQEVMGEELVRNYILVKRMEHETLQQMDEETRRRWLVERY
ncbi:hypothetical protein FE257_006941 [Aspergillus nanangensis]|uniref:GS catalytic domain-containing protein n=1 Tax=Aspergillus nanangensis TaxID=2582783 RepID=A0AAD4CNP6_ASPNN|nr:hypothetical protein FE257_006941 [Aspergillus nanangensis]